MEAARIVPDGAFHRRQHGSRRPQLEQQAHPSNEACLSPQLQAGLFVFNIMVGSGALALPKIFGEAGLALSTVFLCLVAALSIHTQHLLLEAQGVAAVLEGLRL